MAHRAQGTQSTRTPRSSSDPHYVIRRFRAVFSAGDCDPPTIGETVPSLLCGCPTPYLDVLKLAENNNRMSFSVHAPYLYSIIPSGLSPTLSRPGHLDFVHRQTALEPCSADNPQRFSISTVLLSFERRSTTDGDARARGRPGPASPRNKVKRCKIQRKKPLDGETGYSQKRRGLTSAVGIQDSREPGQVWHCLLPTRLDLTLTTQFPSNTDEKYVMDTLSREVE